MDAGFGGRCLQMFSGLVRSRTGWRTAAPAEAAPAEEAPAAEATPAPAAPETEAP